MPKEYLLIDILFKIVFGTEEGESNLRALLNALLGLQAARRIQSVELLNPTIGKNFAEDRGVILDVKARDESGRFYNVEVQIAEKKSYIARSLYYLARLYTEQLNKGDSFDKLSRTVAISLLDYDLFPGRPELHSVFRLQEQSTGEELSDLLEVHYVELSKLSAGLPDATFERWLYFLKYSGLYLEGGEPLPPALLEEEGIEMAFQSMSRAYARDEVRDMIEARRKAEHDEATALKAARDEGRTEGVVMGRAEGVLAGKRAAAQSLLAHGMQRDEVLRLMQLTEQDL